MNSIIISIKEAGLRLDKFLLKTSNLSWNHLQKSLRSQLFTIHGVQVSKDYKLKLNDVLSYPSYLSLSPSKAMPTGHLELFTSNIIFEDQDLIIINKPPGLASQGGINIKLSADQLAAEYSEGKLMHRLDKNASGLLVFGKSRAACSIPILDKTYIGILLGDVKNEGEIRDPLKKSGKAQIICNDGQDALTYYQKIDCHKKNGFTYSLVKFKIVTGRKHQIRVHSAQSLSAPLMGDSKYGGVGGDRIFLHSYSSVVKSQVFIAPLHKDFIDKLQDCGLNFTNLST